MKKAKEQQSQTGADTRYDAAPPERVPVTAGFHDYGEKCLDQQLQETGAGLLLSFSILLLLYAAA